ncbi:beta-1,4-N-acetylgalactosaminyltransferase bre-4 [Trichonephila clavipes]|nr:beta-1,4-N-acetylgalactosaminyltransferase bre-4 [Trichonephila clavipes]
MPRRFGRLKVLTEAPSFDALEQMFSNLQPGGRFRPSDCIARNKVALVIPYRDREEHLRIFLHNLHPILQRQQLDYGRGIHLKMVGEDAIASKMNQRAVIKFLTLEECKLVDIHSRMLAVYGDVCVEAHGDEAADMKFNRAMLMNIGYAEALKQYDYDCFIFHDVDLIPEDDRNLYTCPEQPRHMSVAINTMNYRLPYKDIFGGVSALTKKHMETVNGFSNEFWGWGGEDDDMSNRDCIENDTTMEDDSFRQESPVNTLKQQFFFHKFDTSKFSSFKSFLDCFDQQCLEYQKDEQWKKQNIVRYLTGVYLKFWYDNQLFEKSYQKRKKLNYDDSSIVEHMTLSSPIQFKKFLVIKKISTPCEWISTMRQLIAVTPDNPNQNAVETESCTRWNNQAYGSVHRGTDPGYRFHSRGYHGQQHQSRMVRFNGRQQFNSQPRQFVQQNRHNFRPPRNNENVQRQG